MSLEDFSDQEVLRECRLRRTKQQRAECHKALEKLSYMIDDVDHTSVNVRYTTYSDDRPTDIIIFYIRHREDEHT